MNKPFFNILQIGVGGTGCYFLKEFVRFLSCFPKDQYHLSFVDGDHVEAGNLERQAFLVEDIGRSKALVMEEILSESFDLRNNISAYPFYIDDAMQLRKIFAEHQKVYTDREIDILVGCVDNHRARQVFHELFTDTENIIYLDAANEFQNGEIVTGIKRKGQTVAPDRAYYFPDILTSTEKRASEKSCGESNHDYPQHIAVNMMSGNLLLAKVCQLMAYGRISPGITYFDAFKCTAVDKEFTGGLYGQQKAETA